MAIPKIRSGYGGEMLAGGEEKRGFASIYLLCEQSKFDMCFALDMHTLRCVDMPCKQGVIFARRVGKALPCYFLEKNYDRLCFLRVVLHAFALARCA